MHLLSFDSETLRFGAANMAPEPVCYTWQRSGLEARIIHAHDAKPTIKSWLEDPNTLIIGHHVPYDLAVIGQKWPDLLPLIFDAFDASRITDTKIREQLLDIAAGRFRGYTTSSGFRVVHGYALEEIAKRRAGIVLQKDAWRVSYGEFLHVPLSQWPERAREVQAKARIRIAELDASLAALSKDARKPLDKERAGLVAMVEGDPNRCKEYPLDDARAPLAVYEKQEAHRHLLEDQFRQTYAAFCLHLSSAWGLRTDAQGIAALRAVIESEIEEIDQDLKELGLVRDDGTRDTKKARLRMVAVCKEDGEPIPRTGAHFAGEGKCKDASGNKLPDLRDEKGRPCGHPDCVEHVSLDKDACEGADDPILIAYSQRTTLAKQLSNDIPTLERGAVYPIHTSYGITTTGRTTSSKGQEGLGANIQNQSKRPGFREAFVPRPGMLFLQCDFPGLELFTWAQCCVSWFGVSKMAEALNGGLDPHLWLASYMLNITYDEAARRLEAEDPDTIKVRQQAKPGNFGFPGGMGVDKFLLTQRRQMGRKKFAELGFAGEDGRRRATFLRAKWEEAWPEARLHFARVQALVPHRDARATVETLFTRRIRGGATFCATANNGFQALGADCAKRALCLIARDQYARPESALWNTRTVAFVHDEYLLEVPEELGAANAAANALADRMCEGANEFLPNVPIPRKKLKPALMRRWSKDAKPRYASGQLVPWE